ncbi:MAG: hypothetical protein GWP59_03765, partial [Chlamydiales bacterium]|nr:hypothetical protein [Chlamydiales bacterium]
VYTPLLDLEKKPLATTSDVAKQTENKELSLKWIEVVDSEELDSIKELIALNVDITKELNKEGMTALHLFAKRGKFELVELLLEAKADPHRLSREGLSALDYAHRHQHEEVALLIQDRMLKVDEYNNKQVDEHKGQFTLESAVMTQEVDAETSYLEKILHPYESIKSMLW